MGLTKYEPRSSDHSQTTFLKEIIESEIGTETLQRGGYDGGVTIAFQGRWNLSIFETLVKKFDAAKTQTAVSDTEKAEIILAGIPFFVKARDAKEGIYYDYVIEGAGLKFYLRHVLNEKKQDIRLRYGAEILIGRDFFETHKAVRKFLDDMGFSVTKEILSRVDLQILIERKMNEFMKLIVLEHAVAKARKESIIKNGKKYETYTIGNKKAIQLCLYDKMMEFNKMMVSDPVKAKLFMKHCMGEEIFDSGNPLTRIEFRLGRDALKSFEIDTVDDLRNKEAALVDLLTSEWFRILELKKVRGHENEAKMHEFWEEA